VPHDFSLTMPSTTGNENGQQQQHHPIFNSTNDNKNIDQTTTVLPENPLVYSNNIQCRQREEETSQQQINDTICTSTTPKQQLPKRNDGTKAGGRRRKIKESSRAKHRLWSIYRDFQTIQQLLQQQPWLRSLLDEESSTATTMTSIISTARKNWKIVGNERCGSWYLPPPSMKHSQNVFSTSKIDNGSSRNTTSGGFTTTDQTIDNKDDASGSTTNSDAATCTTPHCGCHCYFKSTDGHINTWDFSLKRLNLSFLQCICEDGGIIVVDSSVRKALPDSFSRTMPIWVCVMNRIVVRYRKEFGLDYDNDVGDDDHSTDDTRSGHDDHIDSRNERSNSTTTQWDTNLYTPACMVPPQEHTMISALMDSRVETLYRSRAIVHPQRLVAMLTKPLKVAWMNHEGILLPETLPLCNNNKHDDDGTVHAPISSSPSAAGTTTTPLDDTYFWIVCWNPSRYQLLGDDKNDAPPVGKDGQGKDSAMYRDVVHVKKTNLHHNGEWNDDPLYYYTPGAADDHESWARHLTPELFWKYQHLLIDPSCSDDEIDELIDRLVESEWIENHHHEDRETENNNQRKSGSGDYHQETCTYSNQIGNLNLWIGSRRAGRPPKCWSTYEAILNVTDEEYPSIMDSAPNHSDTPKSKISQSRYSYLQLPVQEGKRDKTGLEKWLPVGLAFLIQHLQGGKRVLVHCAKGKDRSVAVVLALIIIVCPLVFPLSLRPELATSFDLQILEERVLQLGSTNEDDSKAHTSSDCESSGMSYSTLQGLLSDQGKDIFLQWVHSQIGSNIQEGPLGDKERIRVALHLIRQDREVAEPSRTTMQKINRFFMSSPLYRS
jgi:hypothetical protein